MKDLKQLIAITSRKRIGKIEILQDSLPKKSIQSKLYNIVNDSEDPDEDFIAARLYGKEIDHTDVRFVKQKSRLKEKLLNTILFIEPNDKFLKLKTYAYKQLYFGKVLQFLNSYTLAQKILKKALSVAEKIELFDVAYDAVYQLLSIAALTGEKQEFNSLKTTLLKYEELRDRQLNAKCNYYDLTLNISDPKITNSQRELMIDETIAQLTGLKDYKKHYALKELVYRLTIIKYNIQNDYEAILKCCKEAIKSLLNFEFLPSDSYFHFKYSALDAYYKLNRHQEGIRFIDQVSNNSRFKVSGQNLHLVKKYEVLYSFGELNFDDANETIVEFMSDRAFQKQTEIVKEMWKLYQAYAEWGIKTLQNQGVIKLENQAEPNQSKFRIFKFLNEVPTLSKDKYGYNISLMIIQFLHHLSEFDHGAIIQRIDAMKVYRTRYLRDENLKRLHTFIGMLLKIEKLSFNVNEIEINNKEGYTYLKENPDNLPISDYEIVPFEKVWDLILEQMRASGRSRFAYAS
ncbi:MAG: hypothetical protein KDD32_09195 [Bacteroidetes bacterium]|nr:hypothetical protein [Bacteroidota bacterium]